MDGANSSAAAGCERRRNDAHRASSVIEQLRRPSRATESPRSPGIEDEEELALDPTKSSARLWTELVDRPRTRGLTSLVEVIFGASTGEYSTLIIVSDGGMKVRSDEKNVIPISCDSCDSSISQSSRPP